MNWVLCKFATMMNLFIAQLCTPAMPDTDALTQIDFEATLEKKAAFPVQTFNLNDKKQIKKLYAVNRVREAKTEDRETWGIHGIFTVHNVSDIETLKERFEMVNYSLSTFEIKFENDILEYKDIILGHDIEGLTIIVSGPNDREIDITGVFIAVHTDKVYVHNLKWGNTRLQPALVLKAASEIRLENLTLTNNEGRRYFAPYRPRIELNAAPKNGQLTNATIRNLTFKNNKTSYLLYLKEPQNFGTLIYDNVILDNNKTRILGLDVSASKKNILNHVTITNHIDSPALVQRTPFGEVMIKNSKIPDNAYQYIPAPNYKDKQAKAPIIIP